MARTRRTEFLLWTLFYFAVILLFYFLTATMEEWTTRLIFPLIINIAYILVAVNERFQDINKSGWWSLLIFMPFVNLVVIGYLLVTPGTKGKNKYGPDPRLAKLNIDDPKFIELKLDEYKEKRETLKESLDIGAITRDEFEEKISKLESKLKYDQQKILTKKLLDQGIISIDEYNQKIAELSDSIK